MNVREFASSVDHTLLDKDHTVEAVEREVERANDVGANVCVPPNRVETTADAVDGELMTVAGFPMGYHDTEVKVLEAEKAVEEGADSVDVATDISRLKSGDLEGYRRDVERVTEAVDDVKAILETGVLTHEETRVAAERCVTAGVDYLKTSTGYVGEGATIEDVRLLAEFDVGVKASGGVRSAASAEELLDAGADRVGASAGVELVEEYRSTR